MRAASSALLLLLAACGSREPANEVAPEAVNNATADIEALPADESAATTSEELVNGVNEPDAANLSNDF